MFQAFKEHLENRFPKLRKKRLLLAVSGGLDSMVLCDLCLKMQLDFALAHCNFSLRGNESDTDASFVLEYAEKHGLEVFTQRFDTEVFAVKHGLSIQMAARELRYEWMHDLAQSLNFKRILTAHHADDNLETFIINLSRSSGLEGLAGIPEQNGIIRRPLLPFNREQIREYAIANHITWREDSSNESRKYLRNKIRHDVIPQLKIIDPDFLVHLQKSQKHLKEVHKLVSERTADAKKKVVSKSGDGLKINLKALRKLKHSEVYLYEWLKDYGFSQWEDIYSLPEAQSGKQIFAGKWRLLKNREHLILALKEDKRHYSYSLSEDSSKLVTELGTILIEKADEIGQSDKQTIFVNADSLDFPLTLRKWEKGDWFKPFGLNGKKKLSKFFKDEKLSRIDKEKVMLLCSGEAVVWVVGMRPDERFRIDENTKKILKIQFLP